MIYFAIICAAVALISFVNFIMYGADKRAAVRGKWRYPKEFFLAYRCAAERLAAYSE